MQTAAPYQYGGESFRSLGALQRHIMSAIDYKNRVVGRRFFDAVLADVLVDRHYIWRHRGIRPSSFQFIRNEEDDNRAWTDSLAGLFGLWGWQRCSYQKALRKKPLVMEDDFPRLCRERWKVVWRPRLFRPGPCVGCRQPAVDLDHIEPQHKRIVTACWDALSPADRADWWQQIISKDGDGGWHFKMPEGHPVTGLYDQMTEGGEFQRVCKVHHREATAMRRRGGSGRFAPTAPTTPPPAPDCDIEALLDGW